MPEGDLAKDNRVEIKIAVLDSSFTSEPHYNKLSTKIDIVWEGEAIWQINKREVEMKKGDYVIIPPKTIVCVKKILSDKLIVQVIRFPSITNDKVIV